MLDWLKKFIGIEDSHDDRRSGFALWEAYRIWLVVLADRKMARQDDANPFDKKIVSLLEKGGQKPPQWEDLYEAEQRLSYYLTDDEIRSDFSRRCAEAENLGVKSALGLSIEFQECIKTGKPVHPVYLSLLDDIHFRYIKRHLDRRTRREKGRDMNNIGFVMLVITLVLLMFWTNPEVGQFLSKHYLVVGVWFGMVGAFLSRLISFNSQLPEIDYDALRNGFSMWVNVIRIIIGGFSAAIFTLLIAGNFMSGDLFPKFFEHALEPSITPNTAKLLVWATVSGFSERLIPERFATLESHQNIKPLSSLPPALPVSPVRP